MQEGWKIFFHKKYCKGNQVKIEVFSDNLVNKFDTTLKNSLSTPRMNDGNY